MSRNRLVSAAVSVFILALAASVLAAPAQARSARLPAKPKVGQCRATTFAQTNTFYDSRKPVPCSKPHTMKTFAVVNLPKSVNLKKFNAAKVSAAADKICETRFGKALGGTQATREQTAYTWAYFIATKAAQRKGQRWVRCDVSLLAIRTTGYFTWAPLPNLPFPMIGNRPITDVTRKCLFNDDTDYWTPCNTKHVARSDKTFVVSSTAYPSKATFDSQAAAHCPGERYTTPGKFRWGYGVHTVVCYSATTS